MIAAATGIYTQLTLNSLNVSPGFSPVNTPALPVFSALDTFSASVGLPAFRALDGLNAVWQDSARLMGAGRSQEHSPGQTAAVGENTMAVGRDGNVDITMPGRSLELGINLQAGWSEMGPYGCSSGSAQVGMKMKAQTGPSGLRVEGGNILLPNGKKIPFNNTGAIVVLPDGSKVGVGRNSQNDTQHNRWASAGPGQDIPTSPPGATNVFYLDQEGNVANQGVQ